MKERIKTDIKIMDLYKAYSVYEKTKGRKPVTFTIFYTTINKLLLKCREHLLDANTLYLPYRLGVLQIVKYKRSFDKPKAIDFKKTKELGFKVYYEDPYSYYVSWNKKRSNVKNKTRYKFRPCRKINRLITVALNNNRDFYFLNSK